MTELEALETDLEENYQNDPGYQATKNALDALLNDLIANYEALYNEKCKFGSFWSIYVTFIFRSIVKLTKELHYSSYHTVRNSFSLLLLFFLIHSFDFVK